MKRNKRTRKSKKKHSPQASISSEEPNKKTSRRDFFASLSNVALATAVGGGLTWYIVDEACATTREHDLTRIGNGVATVVQIHDPQCSVCAALQKEARDAMSNFDDNELQYLVANIRQQKGRALANKHGVQHITLLLLDGEGNRRGVLVGPNKSAYLVAAFRNHVSRVSRR
ncbi:MAG: hypothetical protein GKS01_02045 [Alphaproteobacteria bacterium]|nr:hypothetical protein [Alphaproteobacteria bacterium]